MPALHATDRNTARIVLNNLSGDGLATTLFIGSATSK